MPRHIIPFTVRQQLYSEDPELVPVFLVAFSHPGLDDVLQLSSDTTQRLSAPGDPNEIWGTRAFSKDFWFAPMSAILPDSREEQPPATTLVFTLPRADLHAQVVEIVKSIRTPANVDLAVTTSAAPESVLWRHNNFETTVRSADEASIQIDISKRLFFLEPWPCFYMIRQYFPAMFR